MKLPLVCLSGLAKSSDDFWRAVGGGHSRDVAAAPVTNFAFFGTKHADTNEDAVRAFELQMFGSQPIERPLFAAGQIEATADPVIDVPKVAKNDAVDRELFIGGPREIDFILRVEHNVE